MHKRIFNINLSVSGYLSISKRLGYYQKTFYDYFIKNRPGLRLRNPEATN